MTVSECYTIGFGGSHDVTQVAQWLGTAASKGYKKAGLLYHRVCHAVGVPPQHMTGTDEGKAIETAIQDIPSERYLSERILHHNRNVIEEARRGVVQNLYPHAGQKVEPIHVIGLDGMSLAILNEGMIDTLLPLHAASWLGEETLVVQLLKSTPPDAQSALGFNAAHFACLGGHLSILEVLIKQKVPVAVANSALITPLHLAIFFQADDIAPAVHLLLEYGCSLEARTKTVVFEAHDLPFHGAPVDWALQARNRTLARLLVPLQSQSPDANWLNYVIGHFYWELLEDLLPYFQNECGEYPDGLVTWHTAVSPYLDWIGHGQDHTRAIRKTVKLCSDTGLLGFTADGTSHLHDIVGILRSSGDLMLFNAVLDVSPVDYIRHKRPGPYNNPAIVIAFQTTAHKEAFHDTLARLVDYYTLDELEDGRMSFSGSLLGETVESDNVMGARILLERGVDVNKLYIGCEVTVMNPIHECLSRRGSAEMLSLLIDYGADLLTKSPMTGLTPLQYLLAGRIQVNDVLNILCQHSQPKQVYVEALHKSFGLLVLTSIKYDIAASAGNQGSNPQIRSDPQEQFCQLLMHPQFSRFINDPQSADGPTMIQQAAYMLHHSTIKLLLDAGADAARPFRHGSKSILPIQLATLSGRWLRNIKRAGIDHLIGIAHISMGVAMEVAMELLQWHQARNDGLFEGITELHIACCIMYGEAIKEYLRQGQSLEARGRWPGVENMVTPRELAVLNGEYGIRHPIAELVPAFEQEPFGEEFLELVAQPLNESLLV
jgi:hypothetical protein